MEGCGYFFESGFCPVIPIEDPLEIHLQLHSILRDILPPELEGRTVLNLDKGSTLQDLLKEFDISRRVVVSVNDIQESDLARQLIDGDEVKLFTSVSGG